jgi:hypothetical protein
VNAIRRLLLVSCACAGAHAFAAGSDSNAVEPGQPPSQSSPAAPAGAIAPSPAAAPSASSTTTPGATPDPAKARSVANEPAKLVLVDDTVTDAQLKQILAKGYKPESQAAGHEVIYCRRERPMGTRFETKICKTSGRILQDELQGQELGRRAERTSGNPMQH